MRFSKLMEYYSDPIVINALMEQLQVPGTAATHNLMSDQEKKAAIETQIDFYSQSPTSFWYRAVIAIPQVGGLHHRYERRAA
jgi:hypothetical protein